MRSAFLPWDAASFCNMLSLWDAHEEDDLRLLIPVSGETDGFPEELNLTAPDQFAEAPPFDLIVTAYTGSGITGIFSPESLRKKTKRLIYCAPRDLADITDDDERGMTTLPSFIPVPAVLYADEVRVATDAMRALYIEMLSISFGEETRGQWQEKIVACGPLTEEERLFAYRGITIPASWEEKRNGPDGTQKKILFCYHSIASLLEHGFTMIRKLEDILETVVREEKKVVFLLRPDPLIETMKDQLDPSLYDAYREVMRQYGTCESVIVDESKDARAAVWFCDAYYGDPCPAMTDCVTLGKPVMQMSAEVRST